MKFMDCLAQGVGYVVMVMAVFGALTDMKFTLRLTGPDVHLATLYTCESGDSVLTRKKYLCSQQEWEAKKKTGQ